jgi:hypothetical protein
MPKLSRKAERAAWTAHITGEQTPKPSKYSNQPTEGYASKHEAEIAAKLHALARCGQITELAEQVPITLVEGKNGIRPIIYVADFTWIENGKLRVGDAKGYNKNKVYILKKKLLKLLHGLDIQEL